MAHAQKPDSVFQRNGRVHLYRRGCQFSEYWLSWSAGRGRTIVVTLDGLFRVKLETAWLPTPFASFPFTSPPVRHRVPPDSVTTLPPRDLVMPNVGKGECLQKSYHVLLY